LIGIWSRRFGVGRRGSLRAEVARTPNKNKVSSCRHFWSCVRDCPPHQRGWSGVNRRRCLAAGFCEAVGVAPRIQPRAGSGGPEAPTRVEAMGFRELLYLRVVGCLGEQGVRLTPDQKGEIFTVFRPRRRPPQGSWQ